MHQSDFTQNDLVPLTSPHWRCDDVNASGPGAATATARFSRDEPGVYGLHTIRLEIVGSSQTIKERFRAGGTYSDADLWAASQLVGAGMTGGGNALGGRAG